MTRHVQDVRLDSENVVRGDALVEILARMRSGMQDVSFMLARLRMVGVQYYCLYISLIGQYSWLARSPVAPWKKVCFLAVVISFQVKAAS